MDPNNNMDSIIEEEQATKSAGEGGFFSENFHQLAKAQKDIEQVVELIEKDSKKKGRKESRKQKATFEKFLKEL